MRRAGSFIGQPLELPGEHWKPVVGYPNYYVSDFGRIKASGLWTDGRVRAPRIIRPNRAGSVGLCADAERQYFKLAQLILLTFKGPPGPGQYLARHLDDNTSNNMLANLAWGNHQDNYDDGVRNGRHGVGTPGAQVRGNKLRGKPRPAWVREKISTTKQTFPNRQFYNGKRDDIGRFTS